MKSEKPVKILFLVPKSEFSDDQTKTINEVGGTSFVPSRTEMEIDEIVDIEPHCEILGADPDILGGFEKAENGRLTELINKLPDLKVVCLSSSDPNWIDKKLCAQRKIKVTNVPHFCDESIAEHTIGMIIGAAKKMFISDRREHQGKYVLEMGNEIKGKTLGIIGLGGIGTKVAEFGNVLGMNVIAWNRTPKNLANVKMHELNYVLENSDVLSLHIAWTKETRGFFSKDKIDKLKKNCIFVDSTNTFGTIVDEYALADALKQGRIATYVYEAEYPEKSPLYGIENAIYFKPFAWYTKEALERATEIWTDAIVAAAKGKFINEVELL
jgi:phosphoglycerate dehydrogenase-like enzyme